MHSVNSELPKKQGAYRYVMGMLLCDYPLSYFLKQLTTGSPTLDTYLGM